MGDRHRTWSRALLICSIVLCGGTVARGGSPMGSIVTDDFDRGVAREEVHPSAHAARAVAAAVTPGPRRMAVVLLNFTNDGSQPWTPADARALVFTGPRSGNAYLQEVSSARVSLTGIQRADGDVFGWFTVPYDNADCDAFDGTELRYRRWALAAQAAVAAQGVDLSAYDHVMFAWPRTESCLWNGRGQLGGSQTYINGRLIPHVISHELGHNLGAHHARSLTCRDADGRQPASYGQGCIVDEYGDPFDVMGYRYFVLQNDVVTTRHFHAIHKLELDLLPEPNQSTVTSGVHVLAPSAPELPSGTQAIRIPHELDASGVVTTYQHLEFRQPFGTLFDTFAPTDPVANGVTVRLGSGALGHYTYLVDATPETPGNFFDAPIPVGRTLVDPNTGTTIRPLSVTSAGAMVEIAAGPAIGADVPVAGRRLTFRDDPARGATLQVQLDLDDVRIQPHFLLDDGASVQLVNPTTGEGTCLALPAHGWTARKRTKPSTRYRDRDYAFGACDSAKIDGRLTLRCRGRVQPIGFSLDEAQQSALAVVVRTTRGRFCTVFDGDAVRRDQPGFFTAKAVGIPAACPSLPSSCP